ncbi:hypothetical protein LLS1_03040 [Leifsonia sp. LS1]|nr:hypothetical protein LLS1_03040 [Leifsonia sp. LS1]
MATSVILETNLTSYRVMLRECREARRGSDAPPSPPPLPALRRRIQAPSRTVIVSRLGSWFASPP